MIDVRNLTGVEVRGWLLGPVKGEGADGIVYVGTKNCETAAVKIFFPEALKKNGLSEAEDRLQLQLGLMGDKLHPNLVQVLEGGKAAELEDTLYLVMELVPGNSLDNVVDAVPRAAIPSLLKQLASAAQFLDKKGLVHRDIKPANIVVSDDFTHLTLLDLGIVFTASIDNDLSGKEFVATTRYSPPEFVWRNEDRSSDEAWTAITFYQIGATLHDLIMRNPLFNGHDKPRAKLYDAVRYHSPEIEASDCDAWLIHLAKCCLVKNWRERAQLVSWTSFSGPTLNDADFSYQKTAIRLRQIRNQEALRAQEMNGEKDAGNARIVALWNLHDRVYDETRAFLIGSQIFPKFSGTHHRISEKKYQSRFEFEVDDQLMFDRPVTAEINFSIDAQYEMSTDLEIKATCADGVALFEGTWTETLTMESANTIVQQALMQVAEKMVPSL